MSWLLHAITGAALIGIAALAVFRGSANNINPHVLTYYVVNYDDGLIRRGLIGEVFSWFVTQQDLATVKAALLAMYTPLVIVLLAGLFCWVLILERRRRDFLVVALFAVFLSSQMVPTLAYDVGFLDVFDFLLISVAAVALVRRQPWGAAIAGAVGPFIHEAFVFYWLPLVAVGLWDDRTWRRVAVLAAPFISTAVVYLGASHDAATVQIAASVRTRPV